MRAIFSLCEPIATPLLIDHSASVDYPRHCLCERTFPKRHSLLTISSPSPQRNMGNHAQTTPKVNMISCVHTIRRPCWLPWPFEKNDHTAWSPTSRAMQTTYFAKMKRPLIFGKLFVFNSKIEILFVISPLKYSTCPQFHHGGAPKMYFFDNELGRKPVLPRLFSAHSFHSHSHVLETRSSTC